MDILPFDIFDTICSYLDIKSLLNLRITSYIVTMLRKIRMDNRPISIDNIFVRELFTFTAYLAPSLENINKWPSNIRSLNVSGTKLCDVDIIALFSHRCMDTCYDIDLSNTNITNQCVKYLQACRIIKIANTNITSDAMCYLKKCECVDISYTKIDNNGLFYLNNCRTIYAYGTLITDAGLVYINNCTNVHIASTSITDHGLKHLNKCVVAELYDTQISASGISFLKKCKQIYLSNINFSQIDIESLINLNTIYLSCVEISMDIMIDLSKYKKLHIFVNNISNVNLIGNDKLCVIYLFDIPSDVHKLYDSPNITVC